MRRTLLWTSFEWMNYSLMTVWYFLKTGHAFPCPEVAKWEYTMRCLQHIAYLTATARILRGESLDNNPSNACVVRFTFARINYARSQDFPFLWSSVLSHLLGVGGNVTMIHDSRHLNIWQHIKKTKPGIYLRSSQACPHTETCSCQVLVSRVVFREESQCPVVLPRLHNGEKGNLLDKLWYW